MVGGGAHVHGERAHLVVVGALRPDGVRQAPPFPHLLEEPARRCRRRDVIEDGHGPAILRVPARRSQTHDEMDLLGGATGDDEAVRRGIVEAPGASGAAHPARPDEAPCRPPPARCGRGRDRRRPRRTRLAGPVVRGIEEGADLHPASRADDAGRRPEHLRDQRGSGSGNIAPVHCSAARSDGSSACMRISSRMTWRSASMSSGRKAGSVMMAPRTSRPSGRSSDSNRM